MRKQTGSRNRGWLPAIVNRLMLAAGVALVAGLLAGTAGAATATWNGSTSVAWETAGNWTWTPSGSGYPGSGDDVVINGTGSFRPTLDLNNVGSSYTINSLSVGATTAETLTFKNGNVTTKKLRVTGNATIGASGTLSHTAETATGTGGSAEAEKSQLFLDVGGDLTIVANGTINVSSMGYSNYGEKNPFNGYGPGGAADYSGGAGHGGEGGKSGTVGGTTYGSVTDPVRSGSGASPNRGGGAVKLTVGGGLTVNGSISADGGGGAGQFVDGASGGSVNITAGTLAGTGTISANGGGGTTDADRGAGGGGRVAIVLTGAAQSTFDAWFSPTRIKAYGGSHTTAAKAGAAGTVYLKGNSGNGRLIADNNNASSTTLSTTLVKSQTLLFDRIEAKNRGFVKLGSGCTLDLSQGCVLTSDGTSRFIIDSAANPTIQWPASYTLGGGTNCTLSWSGTSQYTINCANLTVATNGQLTHEAVTIQDTTSLEDNKLNAKIQGNLTIDAGGQIYVSLKGYGGTSGNGAGYGPGRGTGDGLSAAHGGEGGNGTAPTYGSVTDPVRCGSGAGYSARGGGAVKLTISGALTLNGSILADGQPGYMSGSGGSVSILAGTLAGSGTVSAVGTYNGDNSGGGGGRVAIVLTNASDTAIYALTAIRANGGPGKYATVAGGAGTVYLKGTNNVYGSLIVDNANVANSSTTTKRTLINSTVGDLTVGDVILRNQGRLSYDATSRKVTTYGSWSNGVANADSAAASVTLAGSAAATVWGDNNWYNLTITNAGKVVKFQAAKTQTINASGTVLFDNNVTLQSTTDGGASGDRWILTKGATSATQDVGKVYVRDSNASLGSTFKASGGASLGNNDHWLFPPKGTVILMR